MYLVLKLLHVAAVVLFLGNIVTGLFWHSHAARTRDPRHLYHAMDGIIRSDRWFTLPGIVAIVAGGVAAAITEHLPILHTGWILWSIVLFSVSGVVFGTRVAPLQRALAALTRSHDASGAFDWSKYHALSRRWELWGLVALFLPLAAMALMVLKPTLPSL